MFRTILQLIVLVIDLEILNIGSGVHQQKIGKWYLLLQVGSCPGCSSLVASFQALQLGDEQMQLMPVVIILSLFSLPLQAMVVGGQKVPEPTAEFLGAFIALARRGNGTEIVKKYILISRKNRYRVILLGPLIVDVPPGQRALQHSGGIGLHPIRISSLRLHFDLGPTTE